MIQSKNPTNLLAGESSPYLLQHKDNPVNWYPWGDQALHLARELDLPIFLSIGYSTCHWCHVMEKECFSVEEVAEVLNKTFLCVKVDREEMPNVDSYYMSLLTASSGSGGWPLSAFLNHNLAPFLMATYIPPYDIGNRRGLISLCEEVSKIWNADREWIDKKGNELVSFGESLLRIEAAQDYTEADLLKWEKVILADYDYANGGFGGAPKFPTFQVIQFLLRRYSRSGSQALLNVASDSLRKIRLSGTFDQVGFGFHRYSTDASWLLPHFEKMLYDQAMALLAYSDAYAATKDNFFKQVCAEIFDYLHERMLASNGLFYSAEDADSEGEEGKFYVFSQKEIEEVISDSDFIDFYNIKPDGNFYEQSTGQLTGDNVLYPGYKPIPDKFLDSLIRLKEYRNQRIAPFKDEKMILEWNALVCGALFQAGRLTGIVELSEAATKCLEVLEKEFLDVRHYPIARTVMGLKKSGTPGLSDYAYLGFAYIEGYLANYSENYLHRAIAIHQKTIEKFLDPSGTFFLGSSPEDLKTPGNIRENYDGAYTSGNSIAVLNGIRLSRISGEYEFGRLSEVNILSIIPLINSHPRGFCGIMMAADLLRGDNPDYMIYRSSNDIRHKLISTWNPWRFFLLLDENSISSFKKTEGISFSDGSVYYECNADHCKKGSANLEELLNEVPLR